MAPLGARAADLVVWWEKGFYPQEDEAVREIIAAFEQESGKQVELVLLSEEESRTSSRRRSRRASRPTSCSAYVWPTTSAMGLRRSARRPLGHRRPFSNLFDPDALACTTLFNATTGQRALYALPMGRATNHVHVWSNLLEQAGFTLEDIPKQWEAFWSFWCDQVQPAVRRATGRDDIWGVGLNMSAEATDTQFSSSSS